LYRKLAGSTVLVYQHTRATGASHHTSQDPYQLTLPFSNVSKRMSMMHLQLEEVLELVVDVRSR